jgi:hypothetical protein
MEALDGNAIGGLLGQVFGAEMTTAVAVCVDLQGLAALG